MPTIHVALAGLHLTSTPRPLRRLDAAGADRTRGRLTLLRAVYPWVYSVYTDYRTRTALAVTAFLILRNFQRQSTAAYLRFR